MITAESLIAPKGPIDPSFFPDDLPPPDVEEGSLIFRLAAYILAAEEKVGSDFLDLTAFNEAVRCWALHLAFRDAHLLMAARPATENYMGGLGGIGYNTEQLKVFGAKAEEYRLRYLELTGSAVAQAPDGGSGSRASRTTKIRFTY